MDIVLNYMVGKQGIDEILAAFIGIFEATFPESIRAYYLEGSYSSGTEVTNSDLDVIVVCKEKALHEEAQRVADYCTKLSQGGLDIYIESEENMAGGVEPMMKGSRFLYGDDILERTPLISLAEWTRDRMHASYRLLIAVFNRPPMVQWPISYPDAQGEFCGYDNRKVVTPDGVQRNSTRNLIRVTGWMATARIAFEAREYIKNKEECYTMYRKWIGDEWSSFLEDTYALCRGKWNYLIPDTPSERAQLREICVYALQWENHFLQVYKRFLLAELQDESNPALEKGIKLLNEIPFYDQQVAAELQKIRSTADPSLRPFIESAFLKLSYSGRYYAG